MAGFFNHLFPNWHPKTIAGKILKGWTAVVMPVASMIGFKKAATLAAEAMGIGELVNTAIDSRSTIQESVTTPGVVQGGKIATNNNPDVLTGNVVNAVGQQVDKALNISPATLILILAGVVVLFLVLRSGANRR